MRFPRWLVLSLLSVILLAVLGAGAWWWVTWPERTAREFAERFGAARIDEAAMMLTEDESVVLFRPPAEEWPAGWKDPFVRMQSRTYSDVLCGRGYAQYKMFGGVIGIARGRVLGFKMVPNPDAWRGRNRAMAAEYGGQ